jgi:20S proteasome alpha/beta subunit
MSLLVCLLGTDGLVLATDSRGTFGDPRGITAQNDLIKKLYLVNERVGILVAGAGDLGSTVVSGFLALPDIASHGVTELTMALHRYAREQFAQWFQLFTIKQTGGDPRPARPDLNFLVAGFELNQESKIYRMSSSLDFAPMLHNYGFGIDGVAQYALYLINRLYDPESAIEDLQYLAAYVITETASQDGKVGGAVQIAHVKEGDTRSLSAGTVEEILLANRKRSQALKKSFLKKGNELSHAQPRKVKPTAGLTALFEATHSPQPDPSAFPIVNSNDEMFKIKDASSTAVTETIVESSTGLTW